MDSVLCLHHGVQRISSTTSCAAELARPSYSFGPSSLSYVSKASTYRTLRQDCLTSPLICVLNDSTPPSPNHNKDNVKNLVRVVGGASVVLACVLGVINCNFSTTATAASTATKARSTASLTQGGDTTVLTKPQDVVDSLLKLYRPLEKKSRWYSSTPKLEKIPERPTPDDRKNLKTGVACLIQSRMCAEAERQLKDMYKQTSGSEPARDVEMELVLVLIIQGNYKEALACKCLADDSSIVTDGRVHFYKAIIHTMLDEYDDAKKCWNSFISSYSPITQDMLKAPSEVPHPKKEREMR